MQNKRIVVKVGTSTLSHPSGLLNIRRVEELVQGPERPKKRRERDHPGLVRGHRHGRRQALAAQAPRRICQRSRPLPPWASAS